jgi:[protein-PII] uridylyltransferase
MPASAAPRLPPAVPRSGVSAEARLALRRLLADDLRGLAGRFPHDADATELAGARAQRVEAVIAHVWVAVLGAPGGCALFAVGGFGRGMLFPHSDVDLLVLARDATATPAMEQFFGVLWDIGIQPGHALRTPAQCRELAIRDARVFTSLLDAHLVAGDAALQADLDAIIDDPRVWPAAEYLAAKREEQAERFAHHAGTSHNLEPNLKEGPGGLRALDLMRWLGRRVARAEDLAALLAAGLLDEAERDALIDAERTLRRYRFALHLAAGRAEERLLFDYQRSLAASLGFEDADGNLGVEQFMQGYYRAAMVVDRIGAQWIARCEELLAPAGGPGRSLDADFLAVGGRVVARDAEVFVRRPRALVEVFALALDHADLHSHSAATMRAIHQGLLHHADDLAEDADVLGAFLDLLRRGAPAVDALVGMNRHGVLAAIVPAFERVVGRMQYDLFHLYTVDEHTLRVLQQLARFADPSARAAFPIACAAWAELGRPELLLLAALFHDIAKGRGGDHSVLGELEARAFCKRLGLGADDVEQVAWLVRWHLRMSVTAQRQDITDPAVVAEFAAHVGDRASLDQLYLLTVADIVGTSPRLWNTWKDRLLADLYQATRFALRAGLSSPPRAEARIRACREAAATLLADVDPAAVGACWRELPPRVFLRLRPELVARFTRLLLDADRDPRRAQVSVQREPIRGGTELLVHAPHRDGLFAAITAVLDRLRFSVVAARIVATHPGTVLDAFTLLDAETEAPAGAARCAELEAVLARTLQRPVGEVRTARRRLPRRLRHFQRPPRIEFRDIGEGRLQLALVATDRPGLLAQVALAMREARVRVHDARIATFGERVEDFFEISDEDDRVPSTAIQAKLHDLLLRRLGGATESTKEPNASP